MELTKKAITEYSTHVDGIEGYLLLIHKIEQHISESPDISVESCKSLIEGLAKKSLSLLCKEYQDDANFRSRCEQNMSHLVTNAFKYIFQNGVEAQMYIALCGFVEQNVRYYELLKKGKILFGNYTFASLTKLNAIRGDRGDISHGRIYPKENESPIYLSQSIVSITDGICSYVIYELGENLKAQTKEIGQNYEDFRDFNAWLDDEVKDFPIENKSYSWLLFEYDRVTYNEKYELYSLNKANIEIIEPEDKKQFHFLNTGTLKLSQVDLAEDVLLLTKSFAEEEKLDFDKLKIVIGRALEYNEEIPENTVVDLVIDRPKLTERKKIRIELIEKLNTFLNTLKDR